MAGQHIHPTFQFQIQEIAQEVQGQIIEIPTFQIQEILLEVHGQISESPTFQIQATVQ